MEKLWFEDYQIGERLISPGRTVTEADVVNFAGLTGDWHPLHTDAEYARSTPFGERIAHGMLTLCVGSALLFRLGQYAALPRVMLCYHNKPEETTETLRDGWMHSGDVAELDADGFFTIIDRIKDILITAGGKNVAPIRIESLLKEEPLISQVVVYGDRKAYLTALITLDEAELTNKAKDWGLEGDYAELTAHPRVREEVARLVEQKNQELARYETIKDFVILDQDLTIEAGFLTPTLKVKRREVFDQFGEMVEALYQK